MHSRRTNSSLHPESVQGSCSVRANQVFHASELGELEPDLTGEDRIHAFSPPSKAIA